MKRTLFVFIVGIIFLTSCNEQPDTAVSETGVVQLDTPRNTDAVAEEAAYYGIDSESDTVVYEKDGAILNAGEITGTFDHMERNEFMYFILADSNGLLHRFFMNTTDQRQMDKYHDGYEPARGHPVRLKWERGALPIREHGGTITVYQAREITE